MTISDIHNALKDPNNRQKLSKILDILNSDDGTVVSKYILKNNNHLDPITVFAHAVICDEVISNNSRYYIDYSLKSNNLMFYNKISIPNLTYGNILSSLPKELWKYLPDKQKSKLQRELQKEARKAKVQTLNLDEFSFLAYKAALTKLKPFSSALALTQMKRMALPKNSITNLELDIKNKYLSIIWDHTPKKSQELCSYIIGITPRGYNEYTLLQYIDRYTNIEDMLLQPRFKDRSHITIDTYQYLARQYNIPVLQELYTDRYSDHYNWITGVEKSTPLNYQQLEMTISQITILDYIITNIQGDSQCPYFIATKEQLVKEISKPTYKENVTKLLSDLVKASTIATTSYTNLLTTLKDN